MEIKNVELLSFEGIDIVLKNNIKIYDSGIVDIDGKQHTYICIQIDFLSIVKDEKYTHYEDEDYTLIDVLFHNGKAFFKGLDMCTYICQFGDIEEQIAFIKKAFQQEIIKNELIPYFEKFEGKYFEHPELDFFKWLKKGNFEIERLSGVFID